MRNLKLWPFIRATGLMLALAPGAASAEHALDTVYRQVTGTALKTAAPETVLRRMSLGLRGVIPTLTETRQFRENPRREAMAVRFLKDPEYAQYQAILLGEVLRERTNDRGTKYASYYEFLSRSLHANKPYNQMVSEMITATGSPDTNPAVNFYLRDDADPLQIAEYVGRAFYGRRFSCARCHDHPFDRSFTRRDYYGLAAFFSQAWVRREREGAFVPRNRREDFPEADRKQYEQKEREWRQTNYDKLSEDQRKKWREQNQLQYVALAIEPKLGIRFPFSDNAQGGDIIRPKFPGGDKPFLEEGEDRRKVFARWLTAQENDRFRKVFINRVWTALMGWSFFTPLDDWTPETKIVGEPILNHLDRVFLREDYRVKELMFHIVTSDAFARQSPPPGGAGGNALAYHVPRRMNPTQLFNSLLRGTHMQRIGGLNERAVAAGPGPAAELNLTGEGSLKGPVEKNREITNACEVPRPAQYNSFLSVFGEGERDEVDGYDPTPTVDQVLALLNGNVSTQVWRGAGAKDAFFAREYAQYKDMNRVFQAVFESLLSRPMSQAEGDLLTANLSTKFQRREPGFEGALVEDLVWSIVNSQEFLHIH